MDGVMHDMQISEKSTGKYFIGEKLSTVKVETRVWGGGGIEVFST